MEYGKIDEVLVTCWYGQGYVKNNLIYISEIFCVILKELTWSEIKEEEGIKFTLFRLGGLLFNDVMLESRNISVTISQAFERL